MLGDLLESEPVKYALALSHGQAVVTRHQGLQPTTCIASLVMFTPG